MEKLLVFETFFEKEQALRTAATLENNGIFVSIEENLSPLDSNFIGQQFNNPYSLKIPGHQFEKAHDILNSQTKINLDDVDPDYVLLSFTDEELIDVLKNRKEWGVYNFKLAEKLLQSRGVPVSADAVAKAQILKEQEHAQPVQYDTYWIVIGYAMVILSLAVTYSDNFYSPVFFTFPMLFALVVGFWLFFSKKTLSNGTRVFMYNRTSRLNGLIIFCLAIIVSLTRFLSVVTS